MSVHHIMKYDWFKKTVLTVYGCHTRYICEREANGNCIQCSWLPYNILLFSTVYPVSVKHMVTASEQVLTKTTFKEILWCTQHS